MVVDDFDIGRSSLIPNETYSPLVIDPDRILALPVSLERFEAVTRWNPKIASRSGLIQKTKLSQRHVLDIRRQFSARRPDQISSVSGSAKLWIMVDYNATRYSVQSMAMSRF